MKWTVKITNKPDLRILVVYEPIENKLHVNGMCKQKNMQWDCIVHSEYDYSENLLIETENIIYQTYEKMIQVLDNVDIIGKIFTKYKEIDINETQSLI
jgi:acetone carboxylase gamma subunit